MTPSHPICPLCGSRQTSLFILDFFHCENCQFRFRNPSDRCSGKEEKERYDQHNNTREDPRYVRWLTTFAKSAVYPYFDPPSRVLDFGCGPGPVLSEILTEKGYVLEIYDPYYFPDTYSSNFDLITATEVAEHLYHPGETLKHLVSLLSPGGGLALKTLFYPVGRDAFGKWWYHADKTHVGFYSTATMNDLAERHTLKIILNDETSVCVYCKL